MKRMIDHREAVRLASAYVLEKHGVSGAPDHVHLHKTRVAGRKRRVWQVLYNGALIQKLPPDPSLTEANASS